MIAKVCIEPSGRTFEVAAGETVLAAGLRSGLALPFGCQSGSCASCRVRLSSGTVHYPEGGAPALSDGERAAGYVLMCLARPASDLVLQLHQPAMLEQLRPRTLPVRVAEHRQLSHDVVGLWVRLPRPAGDGAPFQFLPGQYVDFLLADGKRRSFSIAGADPAGERLEFHLRVTPGGMFAHYVQDDMPDRTILRFEGPLGAFYVREDSTRPAVLVAGGTGFAPIKAMLERQFARGLARRMHLFWGARTAADLYGDALARQWAREQAEFRYTPVLSGDESSWQGERGFVHEAVLRAYPDLHGHEAYLAGPPVMVHAGKRAFVQAGLDADHLYYDSFDYAFETWPELG
ncbi:MAG TPA: 2Fe-2S iron-sulfur cluster-binding protein [Verrucomicrobiae bacterium]|nr:2Fe-2S iron-sulfur cluster-binding protein [Verrucomicrobiae bacterium]